MERFWINQNDRKLTGNLEAMLIKLIIKNFISIILSVPFALISLHVITRILIFILNKILPCDILGRGDMIFIPTLPSPPLPLGCQIILKVIPYPAFLALIILFMIIWYFLLRKLLGKLIKS